MKKIFVFILIGALGVSLPGCQKQPDSIDLISGEDSEGYAVLSEKYGHKVCETAEGVSEASVTPKGTLLQDQTFEVTLDAWGTVTFASFAPESTSFQADGLNPDIRFYLMDGETVLYEFPGWNEEHTNADMFLAVSDIAFKDYNEDGLLDVITLCEYETMSGDGFQMGRIYFQKENRQGFEEDTLLTEYLIKNYRTDSINAIWEAKEEYWGTNLQ